MKSVRLSNRHTTLSFVSILEEWRFYFLFESSIDKMTILGDLNGEESEFIEFLETELLLERYQAKFPYQWSYNLSGKGHLSISPTNAKVPRLRFEFNPNHAKNSNEWWKVYRSVIRRMKNVYLTRIDVAFDYHEDLSHVRWIDMQSRESSRHHAGTGALETWYVGGKRSKITMVMYNKKKERSKANEVKEWQITDKEWWRIEVRFTGADACKKFLDGGFNPFNDIRPHTEFLMLTGLKAMDKAVLKGLASEGGEQLFDDFSYPARRKYKQLLLERTLPCPVDPYSDYEENEKDLLAQVDSWTSYARVAVF